MRRLPFVFALGCAASSASGPSLAASPSPPAALVRLAPSARGHLGAWLVAGPFHADKAALDVAPAGVDEKHLAPSLGAALGLEREIGKKHRPAARWLLASASGGNPGTTGSRTLDLKGSLEDAGGGDLVAYAAGKLHVEEAGRYFLMLSVDDGVRVMVDGAVVLSRDVARPIREDDDLVTLDLSAGDHDLVLKLHQQSGAWGFRAKLVDATLAPPTGAYLALPGTTAADATALAAKMSWLVVDRAFDARGATPRYRPTFTVRYPEGAPRAVPIGVTARLLAPDGQQTAFDVDAGGVVVGASGVQDLVVTLPPVDPWTGTSILEMNVAGRLVRSTFVSRRESEQALVRTEQALAGIGGTEPWLLPGSLDSVLHLTRRLARLVARGDGDGDAQLEEARDLDRLAANLERGIDPYAGRTGMMRRALVTPFDGAPSEFGLYIPPGYKGPSDTKRYPLVIGLHGLNSYPMSLMRALFGLDDDKKEPLWKDRHPVPLPPVDAFVLTPYAHGNTMYREIGEDDVLYLMHWASRLFPIDETRITITGPSMGGIGSASLPLHFPHLFAAAEPLCGYHSYLIRPEITSRPMRPWEHLALEERSNVFWAENGEHLPLWIVHGTRDLPEANSGVLIERYEGLKYSVKHEHPDLGHNVWGPTWADLKGIQWLLGHRLDPHPTHVRFRTVRGRYATSAWLTVDELSSEAGWADVDARITSRSAIALTATGVDALTLSRDARLLDPRGPVAVTADGGRLVFDPAETLALHKVGGRWVKGPPPPTATPKKRGHVTGPIRDAFHEPLVFVYAAGEDARANEQVARSFADRPGIATSYPVMSDAEFLERHEPLANDRALFLVGRTNKVLAALDDAAEDTPLGRFPIKVESGAVTVGKERLTGPGLGAAFIRPNPLRPDRYVVVVAGADVPGTLHASALPELLPDFVVWDGAVAPARGQLTLGSATLRAAGIFKNDWSLPVTIADPLAKGRRSPPAREAAPEPSSDAP